MTLKQNTKQWYLILAAAGLLLGTLLYYIQPVTWKGQALIRIGQMSQNQYQNSSQNQNNSSIEPLPTVVERIKSRAFVKAVAKKVNINGIESLLNVDEGAGMTVKPTRNSDSLAIYVTGGTPELVRASVDGVAAEIISKHDELLHNYLADSKKELETINSEIDTLTKRVALANDKLSKNNGAVAALLIISTQPVLEFKMNRASMLRESISSSNIRRTALIDVPSVTERRILSSLWRASLLGALLSITLGAIWVQWERYSVITKK